MTATAFVLDVRELVGLSHDVLAVLGPPPREVLEAVGTELESQTRARFAQKRAPSGAAWQPWSKNYAKRARSGAKRGRPKQLLRRRGDLFDSIQSHVEGDAVSVGSPQAYASAHQFGTQNAGRSRNVVIPARPFLGFAPRDMDDIRDVVLGWYERRFGGAS